MDITDTYGNYVHRDNRQDTPEHDLGYTGHRYDDTTGLIYAKARYLDTETHGFLSPDPMIYKLPESYLLDPQQMNSYSYARNNPVMYTDPSGEMIQVPVVIGLGIASYFGVKEFGETKSVIQNPQSTSIQKAVSASLYASNFVGLGGVQVVKQTGKQVLKTTGEQGVKQVIKEITPLRGAANPSVKEAAAYGREMHRLDNYNPGEKYLLNRTIEGTKLRPDALLEAHYNDGVRG